MVSQGLAIGANWTLKSAKNDQNMQKKSIFLIKQPFFGQKKGVFIGGQEQAGFPEDQGMRKSIKTVFFCHFQPFFGVFWSKMTIFMQFSVALESRYRGGPKINKNTVFMQFYDKIIKKHENCRQKGMQGGFELKQGVQNH